MNDGTRRMAALLGCCGMLTLATNAAAEGDTRVGVKIENLAPMMGTFQTPFWVGFHEGEFDTYDGNTPASSNPQEGSVAMERICEDGNTDPITADFAELSAGIDATIPGPNGPIAPGDVAMRTFVLDSTSPDQRYFSYASMIIPSNDFCISNGNPVAHPVFAPDGTFIAEDFFVTGAETLDAGTEENDESPANTAFFGQAGPNIGVAEGGVIGTLGSDLPAVGFLPPGSGGILDDPRFRMADFLAPGYPLVKISFTSVPAIVDDLDFAGDLSGANEVPPVRNRARGRATAELREGGTVLNVEANYLSFGRVTAAHLHLAPAGANGPVVVDLIGDPTERTAAERARLRRGFVAELGTGDLVGPLAGLPLDALVAAINEGRIYVNIHTEQFPAGALRGQLG